MLVFYFVVVIVSILYIKLHRFEWSVTNLIFSKALLFLVYNFVECKVLWNVYIAL